MYSTKEDAGDSYDAVFTAFLMQNAVKSNNDFSKDYRNYWNQNIESKVRALPGMPPYAFPYDYAGSDSVMAVYSDSLIAWHALAREYADSKGSLFSSNKPRIEPGTAAFDSLKNEITSGKSLAEGGTKFIDYSALYHAHGEYKFNLFNIAFTTGANGRLYRPNSEGTIFSDTGGRVIKNYEYGLYAGLERFFWEKKLKANLTGRLDKNQNFNFLVSPAASVVYVPKENQIIRLSFSSAIRNPTLQDQFLYYNVGRAILVGNISGMDSLVTISSLYDNFNAQNYDTLDFFNVDPVRPEKVKTFEVGYRTILFKKLYVDAQYYYSFYRDFIGYKLGAEITYDFSINRPTLEHVYRVAANSSDVVTTQGAAIGADYYFGKYYSFSVNYSWNELNKRGSNDPIIPAFNTPKHKFNLGFSGRDIQMKLGKLKLNNWGFNFNFKWIQGFLFEGSPQFTGTVPTYWMLDGQVNKSIPKMHLTFKLGASNILNRSVYQVYGGPAIGRLAYISILLNLDKL